MGQVAPIDEVAARFASGAGGVLLAALLNLAGKGLVVTFLFAAIIYLLEKKTVVQVSDLIRENWPGRSDNSLADE